MLRTLKILCILLKVIMLTRAITDLKDLENPKDLSSLSFQFSSNHEYVSSNTEYIQNYSDSVIAKNKVGLQENTTLSPENIPSEPTIPRAFVDFGNSLIEKDIIVTFRWNKPKFANGVIQKYRIQWFENLNQTIQSSVDIISNKTLQHKVYNLKPDTIYYFIVQAHNEFGAGFYTKFINVSTTHENPIPLLYFTWWRNNYVLDIDLQIAFRINNHLVEIVYSALEHKIYGITQTNELITTDFNPNTIEMNLNYAKIAKLKMQATNLCLDWIHRNLYWTQRVSNSFEDRETYEIIKLDLTLWQQKGMEKYVRISQNRKVVTFLQVLPYTRYLYWLGFNSDKKENIIMRLDFNGKNTTVILKNHICQYKLERSSFMQIDTMNVDKPLMYWILENNLIVTDINGYKCNLILRARKNETFDKLTIDGINIYLYNNDDTIYIIKKKYALLESKENSFEIVEKINVQGIHISFFAIYYQLKPLDKSLQLYPPTICLTPKMEDYRVEEVLTTANSIEVSFPKPILNDGCEKYNLATTIYNISVSYLTCLEDSSNKTEQFNIETYKRYYEIKNLTPFTEYTLNLALSNFYVDKLSMGLQFGSDVKLTTAPGKLNAPEDVTVQVLTNTQVIVHWMPPKQLNCIKVHYFVNCIQLSNSTDKNTKINYVSKIERTTDGKIFEIIELELEHKYKIYVRMYVNNFDSLYTDSSNKTFYMSGPNNLKLSEVSTNSMNISWIPSINTTIHTEFRFILEYKNDAMKGWQIANNTEWNNDKVTYYIQNLLPRTLHKFRLILSYPNYMEDFIWPNEGFTFETLGNVPSAPGIPTVTRLPNFTYHLKWEPAEYHESQVTLYRLEGLIVENNYKEGNHTDKINEWNLYYNGTDNYWITTRDMNRKYQFRVQAENTYGRGVWSESSAIVNLTLTDSTKGSTMQYYDSYIYYMSVILIYVATVAIYYIYYLYCHIKSPIVNKIPSVNFELNPMYAPNPQSDPDIFARGIIEKKKITLGKLLGSGNFGEVYQGTVENLKKSKTMPVAIKMLPEGATPQQKNEFFKEAKIMRDFDHKHVLKLLGICLDTDSPWLILELMEAGDLLTYLKESRALQPSDLHALRLQDLIAMCEDVARGCRYLEEQHYVHRDLACRNCLISARDREHRIVKISDFGLARDVYQNDYYCMKRGTPLPVRWMAPESLKKKKFTPQSDVWAFGVLMWEITSFGQRPYAAIDDDKIIEHVRAGNKLSKPRNCPDKLYELMLRCWNEVNQRPKFRICLENIQTLKVEIQDAMLIPWNNSRHIQLPPSKKSEYLQMTDLN